MINKVQDKIPCAALCLVTVYCIAKSLVHHCSQVELLSCLELVFSLWLLRGKSPCHWAESASRRLQDVSSVASSEASWCSFGMELLFFAASQLCHGCSLQSINRTGLILSMPPFRLQEDITFTNLQKFQRQHLLVHLSDDGSYYMTDLLHHAPFNRIEIAHRLCGGRGSAASQFTDREITPIVSRDKNNLSVIRSPSHRIVMSSVFAGRSWHIEYPAKADW